ncbi:MAG TPA: LLM class F420-dependent oxidoreductase [Acidimicrobiia bacterium]|jgi:F420-dependent oxidoreductase-like protein|nr:LLM class F420-dependent oxidoreductase [Acidimicrobiia bacterium]
MTKFGLQIPNFTFSGVPDREMFEHVADLAVAGEQAGFDSVWVMDHFWQLPPLGGPAQPMLEGYTLLGGLAARTRRVKLGTLVTGVTYRNPALLAKMATTLDIVSSGRAMLGLGAAWYEEEHDAFGFDFPSAGERLDRLEEALQICRAMFTEEAPSFAGTHYRIEKALNVPRPVQPNGPRIMVGGSGEKRTLRLVAQYADMCNINGSPDTIRHLLEVLHGHCADVGRDPSEITTTRLGSLFLTSSAEEAEQTAGFLRDAAGADFEERFTVGDPGAVIDQVDALVDAGLDELIFNLPFADPATVRRAGELLVARFG